MTTPRHSGPEPITDPEYARQLGASLRAIREQRGWSLRDVQAASDGRFTASAVGTYERGERGISVQRLSELAQLYGVPLERLLPETSDPQGRRGWRPSEDDGPSREVEGRRSEKVVIDLVVLEERTEPELETIRRYVDAIKLTRGDFNGRMLSVRQSDVWAWSAMSAVDTESFVERLDRLEILRQG